MLGERGPRATQISSQLVSPIRLSRMRAQFTAAELG